MSDYWKCRIIGNVGLLEMSDYWKCRIIGNVELLEMSNYWKCRIIGNVEFSFFIGLIFFIMLCVFEEKGCLSA